MSISHCYCSDYMTKPTQFGDEPKKNTSFAPYLRNFSPFNKKNLNYCCRILIIVVHLHREIKKALTRLLCFFVSHRRFVFSVRRVP